MDQGTSWEETINPGLEGRLISFTAILELEQELGPQDNFTLQLEIPDDGYRKAVKTEGGNITANETSKAEMDRFGINPLGEDGTYTADFADDVLQQLLLSRVIVMAKESGYGQFSPNRLTQTHCLRVYQTQIQEMIGHWKLSLNYRFQYLLRLQCEIIVI